MEKLIRSWKRYFFKGFSIQQRVPLLICILLLIVMVTFGVISYLSVKKTAENAGEQRLRSLGEQFGNLLSQSAQSMININRQTAELPEIKECLVQRISTEKTVSVLNKLIIDSQSVMAEVIDKKRQSLCRAEKEYMKGKIDFASFKVRYPNIDTGRVGKIQRFGDSLYYPVITGIRINDSLGGYLVRWRHLYNSPKSVEQLSQLMGGAAHLYIGNADNSHWTNMMTPIENPLPANAHVERDRYEFEDSNSDKILATIKPIRQTPWQVMISLSNKTIMQPASQFLNKVIFAGGILVIIGIFLAWLMSRNITNPLQRLTNAAASIANGNYSTEVPIDRRDEVGKLSRAFNAMSAQINKAKSELENKVQEAEHMSVRLRELSAHLQNIREEERKHIAREMHDELGQFLTGLKMDIKWLDKKIEDSKENAGAREKLSEMAKMVDDAVLFVRKLAAELRPSILDDLGLIAALEWHSQEFMKRFNIEVDFKSEVQDIQTTPVIATGLFRMYQESLTNVARHASAKKVTAFLEVDEFIQLTIKDDGQGFDIKGIGDRKTLGLLGMRERAFMIGGKLEIISAPGEGTSIIIKIPLNQEVVIS